MSSHHFVREGQEPAVFIYDALSYHHAAPLFEWAPQILVSEKAIEAVLSWGVKIDGVLASGSAEGKLSEMLTGQGPYQFIQVDADGPFATLFRYLQSQGQMAVSILTDAPLELIRCGLNPQFPLSINMVSSTMKWSFIRGSFEKWMAHREGITIESFGQEISFRNLKEAEGGFTVANDGLIEIKCRGPFWVGLSY